MLNCLHAIVWTPDFCPRKFGGDGFTHGPPVGDRHAIKAAIQAYHCAYRAVRGTPFALQLAPAAEEMGVMSTDEPRPRPNHSLWWLPQRVR